MATNAPASRSRHSSSAAAERVVPSFFASVRHARIVQRADHVVARGQPRARDAMRDHLGIAEDRRAGGQGDPRDGATRPWPNTMWLRRFRAAARMNHAHHDIGLVLGKARKVGLGANDGERALVDRIAVANIVVTAHREPPRARTSCTSRSGNASAVTEHDSTPSANTSQRPSRPNTARGAGAGWAQPLAQPEIWMISPSGSDRAASAIAGAIARAAISPDAQIGAPAQATTFRRGSAGSTMKPSALGLGDELARCSRRQTHQQQCAAGRGSEPRCAGLTGRRDQAQQRFRIRMPERQADAQRVAAR